MQDQVGAGSTQFDLPRLCVVRFRQMRRRVLFNLTNSPRATMHQEVGPYLVYIISDRQADGGLLDSTSEICRNRRRLFTIRCSWISPQNAAESSCDLWGRFQGMRCDQGSSPVPFPPSLSGISTLMRVVEYSWGPRVAEFHVTMRVD